ncbi:MAG: DUF4380 domain-containing protein [Planctomycetota bacterium]|jgi:hypothetical protein
MEMRSRKRRAASVLTCLALLSVLGCESPTRTWQGIHLRNNLIDVQVVPEIGGRVIQYRLGDYDFFWVNRELAGTKPPEGGVGPKGEWLNYGGDKMWPAPQGWDSDRQWPGPPDAVLDGGPYTAWTVTENTRVTAVNLTSQEDKRSGIQFSRVLRIFDDSTHVSVEAAMKNIDNKPRRWGIWTVTQFDTGNRHGDGYNQNYRAYCPLNPDSMFHKGCTVLYGPVNNMSFRPDYANQMMRVHYEHRVGKIGLDSSAGWVATVDATDGYVFVHRFKHEPDKEYPDDSSVEFWSNGLGEFVAWGKVNRMPEGPKDNPRLLETEILSPFAALEPGESYTFHYDWYAAKIPCNLPVTACSDVGVTCKPFSARLRKNKIYPEGSFGVFYRGYAGLVFIDEQNAVLGTDSLLIPVTPLGALDLSAVSVLRSGLKMPDTAKQLALWLYDTEKKFIGELGRTQISQP